METDENIQVESDGQEKEIPLCLKCLQPVDSLCHYCPNCGEAVGQLTPYIPYVNIPWQTQIWGRMWQQLWSRKISFAGKLFRLFMIVWNVPVMLIGIIPRLWYELKRRRYKYIRAKTRKFEQEL
jgi:hypothetical protein